MREARCGACGLGMLTAPGCASFVYRTDAGGVVAPFRYGQEPPLAELAGAELLPERCRDCGAWIGQHHHPGCVVETCPSCGARAVACGCGLRRQLPGSAGAMAARRSVQAGVPPADPVGGRSAPTA